MYCKYCGKQIGGQASFCSNCGKGVNKNTTINKSSLAKVFTVVMLILSFYGIFADAISITDEGELNPLGFVILFLLVGCAIVLHKTRVYLVDIICFGAISIIYLVRIINLKEVLMDKYGWFIDFESFKTLYWAYFIILSVSSVVLAIKYLHENKSESILNIINQFKDTKRLTSEDIKNIVLSGMHKKKIQIYLIIGFTSCFIIIFSYLLLLRPYRYVLRIVYFISAIRAGYFLRSILSFLFMGLFFYTIYSNVKNRKPIIQINRCFTIAICAFIIQLYSLIISFLDYSSHEESIILDNRSIVQGIVIVLNIGLCFSFNKIRRSFKGNIRNIQLKISIIFSMVCFWISLAGGVSSIYNDLGMSYIVIFVDVMREIVLIILLLLLYNMYKYFKALGVNVK